MVGGIDRYYQIARCLRDEDLRADRQYEFMQLDAEASFVDQDDVLAFISRGGARRRRGGDSASGPATIPQITWHEAMDRYGVDKPDLRFGMELVELTEVFAATEFKAFASAGAIKGTPGRRARRPTTAATSSTASPTAPSSSAPRAWCGCEVGDGGALDSPVAKFLSDDRAGRARRRAWAPRPATCCCSSPTSG